MAKVATDTATSQVVSLDQFEMVVTFAASASVATAIMVYIIISLNLELFAVEVFKDEAFTCGLLD